jgi:hypothetical protein
MLAADVPTLDERDFSSDELGKVRFGRSRFLSGLGAMLFGYTTALLVRADPALAQHLAIPWPCEGFGECHYCNGSLCTNYCSWPGPPHTHCRSGGQYWETCTPAGSLYRCRDWHEQFPGYALHHCICSAGLGSCR